MRLIFIWTIILSLNHAGKFKCGHNDIYEPKSVTLFHVSVLEHPTKLILSSYVLPVSKNV